MPEMASKRTPCRWDNACLHWPLDAEPMGHMAAAGHSVATCKYNITSGWVYDNYGRNTNAPCFVRSYVGTMGVTTTSPGAGYTETREHVQVANSGAALRGPTSFVCIVNICMYKV